MSNQMENIITYIRNILRKEGITGMDSVTHCIVFVVFRMMTIDMCISIGINESLAFDNAINDEDGEELSAQELYDKFYYKENKQLNFVGEFINKLNFSNFNFKMEGINNLKNIIDKLKKLNVKELATKYDLIGNIYELHLKSGTSKGAMRDLGQYYTHRLVIKYMIELCKPQVKNGIVEKIVDPTMGTGGFLTMSIKYLNEQYKGKKAIDWEKNKDSIIGFDIDDNVKNMALLNVFLEIGQLCKDTIVKQDTLHCDLMFPQTGEILDKADIILANEPMGLKNIVHANCCERIKEMKIRGTKAEPLFLQLFMEALNDGGRCVVIVPDGVLFNESTQHQATRKYLVENYNLKKVVSLKDKDFFLNTDVKTSILFFANDGTNTHEVDFCNITINTDDIVETSVVKVSYKNIITNNYSLFVNKYIVEVIDKIDGIQYKKLGDLLVKKTGKSLSRIKMKEGLYPVISGGAEYGGYHNEYNYDEKLLFIARVGTAGHISCYNGKCFVTDLVGGYSVISNKARFEYIYYYLKFNEDLIKNNFVMSTGAPSINLSILLDKYEIAIPSLQIQDAIIERLNLLSENNKTMEQNIEQLKSVIKYYVDVSTKKCKGFKLSDICELKPGKYNSQDCKTNGKYPFYSSKAVNPVGYLDLFCFDFPNYLILIKDGGAGYKKYGDHIGLGKVFKVTGKSAATNHQLALIPLKNNISNNYLYYYLSSIKNDIMDLALYTTRLGNIRKEKLEKLNIQIPSKEKQEEIVKYCDNLTDMIQKQEIQIKLNKELMKQIMDNYLFSDKNVAIKYNSKQNAVKKTVVKKALKNVTVSNEEEDYEDEYESNDEEDYEDDDHEINTNNEHNKKIQHVAKVVANTNNKTKTMIKTENIVSKSKKDNNIIITKTRKNINK